MIIYVYFITLEYVVFTIIIFYTVNFFINVNKHCSSICSYSVEI